MTIQNRNGVPSAASAGRHGHTLITSEKLRQLHSLALRLQLRASRAEAGNPPCAWMSGYEAVLAAAAADLIEDDSIVSERPGSVDDLLRGAPAFAERRSFERRVIDALSAALAVRMRKTGRVCLIFSRGVAVSAVLNEARAIAGAANLPVLFVDDGDDVLQSRPAAARSVSVAAAYPTIPVDAHDVIAMYRVAHESIARARHGGGPTRIVGLRWSLAQKNRSHAGTAASEDAVHHLEEWLIARGLPAPEWRREIVAQFESSENRQTLDMHHGSVSVSETGDAETRAIA
jgi:hypothetical protein